MYLEMYLKADMSTEQWKRHTASALFHLIKDMTDNIDHCNMASYRGMASCLFKKSSLSYSSFVEVILIAQGIARKKGFPEIHDVLDKLRY